MPRPGHRRLPFSAPTDPGPPTLDLAPPVEIDPRRRLQVEFLWWSAILLVVAIAALWVDTSAARLLGPDSRLIRGEIRAMVMLSEGFAHGTGVVLICLALFALDQKRRWLFGLPMAVALIAGTLSNMVKIFGIARTRPRAFDLDQPITQSFGSPLPIFWSEGYDLSAANYQSFPSGHAATAAGFCVALTFFYPNARWFFVLMVGLAGLQRVAASAHFPTDVLVGWAIGFSLAGFYLWFAPERWAERASRFIPLGLRNWVDRRLQWPSD